MFKKLIFIIVILFLLLTLTGCKKRLDVKIQELVKENCVCEGMICECRERYTDNALILNCENVTINSVIDIMRDCKYSCIIEGSEWCRKG